MIAEHAAAVLALLDADNTAPALLVFDGVVPAGTSPGPTPYVVVYFESGHPDLTFTGATHRFDLRIICHSVAGGNQSVRIVADRVAAALLNVTPTVSGRTCWPIRWESGSPPIRHERTGDLVMNAVDVFVLTSIPG
jgi:hypothetical protein